MGNGNKQYWTKGRPQDWSDMQDWPSLKDEFFNTRKADNSYAYRTASQFAGEKYPGRTKDDVRQRHFLSWSIGSQAVKSIKWQGDWESDRILHSTRFAQQTQALRDKVQNELDLLEAGKLIADSYLPLQQRVHDLWKELEVFTEGAILRDISHITDEKKHLKAEAANFKRMHLYMDTLEWIVNMKTKIDNQFLRALGWDRPQFIAYFQGLQKDAQKSKELSNGQSSALNDMLMELTKNQIEKSKMYELELPEDIEVVAKAMDDEKEKEDVTK